MSKTLKKILIITGASLAALFLVFFVLYKIFVTPAMKLQLSLLNAADDVSESFDLFINDDEEDLLEYVLTKGGNSSYNLTLSKSPLLEGSALSLNTVGTAKSAVTELDLNKFLSLDIYSTSDEILINIPFYNGGLKLPLKSDAAVWENSPFKDAYNSLPHFPQSEIAQYIQSNDIDIYEFVKLNKKQLVSWMAHISVSADGSDKVKIGEDEKSASVYKITITKENAEELADILSSYLEKTGKTAQSDIKADVSALLTDTSVIFKVRNFNIYEINILNKDGYSVNLEFFGKGNQFDSISLYENDNTDAAVTRIRKKNSKLTTDTISQGKNELLRLERTKSDSSLIINSDSSKIKVTAKGEEVDENSLSFDTLEISFGDYISVSGRYMLTKRTKNEKADFNKAENYIDITQLSVPDWEDIKEKMISIVGMIPKI